MEQKQQTNLVPETADSLTNPIQETVVQPTVPPTTIGQETVVQPTVPPTTIGQETVAQPTVPPTTIGQETVAQPTVPPTTIGQETVVSQPVISKSTAEEMAGKTIEKKVGAISRKNNQLQSEPVILYNPSLRLIPRHEPADVISTQRDSSLVDWLETLGRMLPRDPSELEKYTEEEEEISELIAVDDNFHDDNILDENVEDSGG